MTSLPERRPFLERRARALTLSGRGAERSHRPADLDNGGNGWADKGVRKRDPTLLRRERRWAARGLSGLLPAALAVCLVASTLMAGSRYFYCSMVDETRLSSCCPEHRSGGASQSAELRSSPCCEPRLLGALPSADVVRSPSIAAAPLFAVLAPFPARAPVLVQPAKTFEPRRGSDPPTASQARSQLMVFLI